MSTCVVPEITVPLVAELIAEQFPQWAHLSIKPVDVSGWDNRTFRLGNTMSLRLPSAQVYALQVHKEQTWLPLLAPHLSCKIPKPLAMGNPSKNYPWHWSVYTWIEGETPRASAIEVHQLQELALDLARFLCELHTIDATGGPVPGPHNFYRGGSLAVYDAQTKDAIFQLQYLIDTDLARRVWQTALSSTWSKQGVWVHGDLSADNILVQNNQLVAVIDFGCLAVGDPACDLVIAWTFFTGKSRDTFRAQVKLDADTWARARGWALWKALITVAQLQDKTNSKALQQLHIIRDILNEDVD